MISMFGHVSGKRTTAHANSPIIVHDVAGEGTAVAEDKAGRGLAPRTLANPPIRDVAAERPQ